MVEIELKKAWKVESVVGEVDDLGARVACGDAPRIIRPTLYHYSANIEAPSILRANLQVLHKGLGEKVEMWPLASALLFL